MNVKLKLLTVLLLFGMGASCPADAPTASETETIVHDGKGKDIEAWLRIVLADERNRQLREVMDLKFLAKQAENEVAKTELARRLDILNHEAQQLQAMQSTYLRSDMYAEQHKILESRVDELRIWKNNSEGKQTVITVVISACISLGTIGISWVLNNYKKPK